MIQPTTQGPSIFSWRLNLWKGGASPAHSHWAHSSSNISTFRRQCKTHLSTQSFLNIRSSSTPYSNLICISFFPIPTLHLSPHKTPWFLRLISDIRFPLPWEDGGRKGMSLLLLVWTAGLFKGSFLTAQKTLNTQVRDIPPTVVLEEKGDRKKR